MLFKVFFKLYIVIFVNFYFFFVCMLLFFLRKMKEDMFVLIYNVLELEFIILLYIFFFMKFNLVDMN